MKTTTADQKMENDWNKVHAEARRRGGEIGREFSGSFLNRFRSNGAPMELEFDAIGA